MKIFKSNRFVNEAASTNDIEKSASALESLISREFGIDVSIKSIQAKDFDSVVIKASKSAVSSSDKSLAAALSNSISIDFGKSFYDEDEQEITFDTASVIFYSASKSTSAPLYKTIAYAIANKQWRVFY